jgi:hypothetical protein
MSPPTFIDKLLHVIMNSGPLGFAMMFAATVVFLLRYFIPQTVAFIEPSVLGYILYLGLIGAGLVFLKIWMWGSKQGSAIWTYLKQRNKHVTAAARIDDLLPEELKGLCWMLLNQDKKIIGRRIDDPFEGLLRKGFIVTTDGKELLQVFRVHPYVKSRSDFILAFMPEKLRERFTGAAAPWDEDRRGRMRL